MLAVYAGMGAAEVRSYAAGALDPDVERYAPDTALADIKATLFWYQQRGTVMKGQPAHAAVDSIDTAVDPQRATITDCVDSSGYDKLSKDGKPVASRARPLRGEFAQVCHRWPGGALLGPGDGRFNSADSCY